ncbi:MAG: hypothetical protein VB948_14010 [Pseudomonadales bacterium]|jgi:hypothetical protein
MSKWIGFTIIALLLGGCVEFERQTMVYRHDTERDELRMLMIYEGIYGSGREERDRKELLSVLLRPRTFFFSNWLLEYDRDQWIELADDLAEHRFASAEGKVVLIKGIDDGEG